MYVAIIDTLAYCAASIVLFPWRNITVGCSTFSSFFTITGGFCRLAMASFFSSSAMAMRLRAMVFSFALLAARSSFILLLRSSISAWLRSSASLKLWVPLLLPNL